MTTMLIQTGSLPAAGKNALCERMTAIAADGPAAITRRLDELSREWTTGRLVKATTGGLLFAGLALTAFVSPWFLILMAAAAAVLVQYWFFPRSWLATLYARTGFRSGAQIEDERLALRVLRGDFKYLPTMAQIEDREVVTRMVDEGGPAHAHDDDEKYDPKEAAEMILQKTC